MLNIQACREKLGSTGTHMTDKELEELRDLLTIFAKTFIEDFKSRFKQLSSKVRVLIDCDIDFVGVETEGLIIRKSLGLRIETLNTIHLRKVSYGEC